jgi:hypothetical protein
MRRIAPLLVLLVAVVGCGSSSSGGSSGTTTTAAANRRDQIAECMRKQGVNFPNRPRGASGPTGPRGPGGGGGGFLFGGGGNGGGPGRFQNDPKFQAAAKKCGLSFNRAAGQRGGFANNPQFRTSINKFVACVRKNGYDLPAANFSGNGPVFDASKVNRNDPKFVKAAQKCQSLLSFGRGATGPGGPPSPQ